MDSSVAKYLVSMSGGAVLKIQALTDSDASASIISLYLARQLGLDAEDPGSAKLEDASGTQMDVTAMANVAVRENMGIPIVFKVLVSKSLGNGEMLIGIEDLKTLHILHQDFPKTLPKYRRSYMGQHVCNHSAAAKDEEEECEKERARGVLLYLEERYEKEDNRIKDLHKFPEEIREVLNKFADVFDTSLKKCMNVPDAQLNLTEDYRPTRCYACRPTPLHYMGYRRMGIACALCQEAQQGAPRPPAGHRIHGAE